MDLQPLNIITPRLTIKHFDLSMAHDVLVNSHDEDVKTFTPDEYFEDDEQVTDLLKRFISNYETLTSPLVYPVFLADINIGYVQVVQLENKNWEVGYHIAKPFTKKGYGSEALAAFLPSIMKKLDIDKVYGIADMNNLQSITIMKKCDFVLTDYTYRNDRLVYVYQAPQTIR